MWEFQEWVFYRTNPAKEQTTQQIIWCFRQPNTFYKTISTIVFLKLIKEVCEFNIWMKMFENEKICTFIIIYFNQYQQKTKLYTTLSATLSMVTSLCWHNANYNFHRNFNGTNKNYISGEHCVLNYVGGIDLSRRRKQLFWIRLYIWVLFFNAVKSNRMDTWQATNENKIN